MILSQELNGKTRPFQHAFFGAVAQYWPRDDFAVAAGPGLTLFDIPPPAGEEDVPATLGFGVALRAAYQVLGSRRHSLRLAVETIPGWYEGQIVVGTTAVVEWQLL